MVKRADDHGKVRLFVYGTLKAGHGNHTLLEEAGAKFLGYDAIRFNNAVFLDLGGFPATIRVSQVCPQLVRGEIWYGENNLLDSIDMLEGHPHFFRRTKERTVIHDRNCWVYTIPDENWMSEGEDFMEQSFWKPQEKEQSFWKTYIKTGEPNKLTKEIEKEPKAI